MWYLNYCSPFMFKTGTPPQIYRYVMYSELYALFIIYLIITIVYKFFGKIQPQRPKFANQHPDTINDGSKLPCSGQQTWVSSKKFKQWYLSYFGLHSIAVGICIFYSPYLPQMVFTLIHFVLWIAAIILFNMRSPKRKVIQYLYSGIMVLVCLLNVMLLFSGSMGVGASGYDQNAKICLLQSGL